MTIQSFVVNAPITIPVTNGFLTQFTALSPVLAVPGGGGYGRTQASYMPSLLHVRGTLDAVPMLFVDFMDMGIPYYNNMSLPYFGDLAILNVPFGSSWTCAVSDIYIPRP